MSKKILFFSNQGISPLFLGIELEIMQKLADQNHALYFTTCGGNTLSCFFNPVSNPVGCAICQSRNIDFHKLLDAASIHRIPFPNALIDSEVQKYHYKNYDDIKNWNYQGINIGRGILSSTISLKREYDVRESSMKSLIFKELKVALKSIKGFIEVFEKVRPDEVYIFNGRFSESYPIVSYCRSKNIVFHTYETGTTEQTYEVFNNNLPHSIVARQHNMKKLWDPISDDKIKVATDWFKDKLLGSNTDDKVYIKDQERALLPEGFNFQKTNITFFNSSEDEMKTIEEWEHDIYANQNEAIKTIVAHYQSNDNLHFYLRNHPNLANVKNSQTKELIDFNYSNFTLIQSNDKVDSYALMKASNIIICFGSTIGLEATYHGKISILLGKSFYTNLDAVYEPQSFQELYDIVDQLQFLQPKPRQNTLAYAYYVTHRGVTFKDFKYNNKFESWYKGKLLKRFTLPTFFYILVYSPQFFRYFYFFKILYGRYPKFSELKRLRI